MDTKYVQCFCDLRESKWVKRDLEGRREKRNRAAAEGHGAKEGFILKSFLKYYFKPHLYRDVTHLVKRKKLLM